jgi:uncharacterized protein YndB with AHSA1/START domain
MIKMADSRINVTVTSSVNTHIENIWETWTNPVHIINWNFASDEWHCPRVENDLRPEGRFIYEMAAKDGSTGFNFSGKYLSVVYLKEIEYIIDDGRRVKIKFIRDGNRTEIIESFEAEKIHPVELQKQGWQSILNNFKKYTETLFTKQ